MQVGSWSEVTSSLNKITSKIPFSSNDKYAGPVVLCLSVIKYVSNMAHRPQDLVFQYKLTTSTHHMID